MTQIIRQSNKSLPIPPKSKSKLFKKYLLISSLNLITNTNDVIKNRTIYRTSPFNPDNPNIPAMIPVLIAL